MSYANYFLFFCGKGKTQSKTLIRETKHIAIVIVQGPVQGIGEKWNSKRRLAAQYFLHFFAFGQFIYQFV
jgi:hypothetical protein